MKKLSKNYLITFIIALLILSGIGSICYSYSRPIVSKKGSVIVSPNVTEAQIDEKDVPLQVIKTEKIDNIEGLNTLRGLVGDNEAIVRIGMNKKEIEETYDKYKNSMNENEAKFNEEINGVYYKLNLSTGQKEPYKLDGYPVKFSPDKTKYTYSIKVDSMYIHDVKSNVDKEINMGPIIKFQWSKDSKYIIAMKFKEKNMYCIIYDVEKDTVKEIKMSDNFVQQYVPIYSNNGKEVYFSCIIKDLNNSEQDKYVIYKLNVNDEKYEEIMVLPPFKDSSDSNSSEINGPFSVINKGKNIVFNGKINCDRGLFIYDVENKKFNKVDGNENSSIRFYVSPDEDKIVYSIFNQTNGNKSGITANMIGNVYAAKIKDNKLENKILLCKDIDSYNFYGGSSIIWSNDSKKVVISEFKTFDIEVKRPDLDIMSIVEKGIIHSIYFK